MGDVARRIMSGEADCIVGGDSDYQMYIGPIPFKDIIIRDIAIDHRNLSLKSGKFVTGQEDKKNWIESKLKFGKANKENYFPLKKHFYPAFDKLSDPFCRVCLAIAMGSDVLPEGLHNFGPAKAFEIKQQIDHIDCVVEKRNQVVKSILCHDEKQKEKNRRNIDEKSLRCYVGSIMFEPTCNGYIYTSPEILPAYLEEYKLENNEIEITNKEQISICHGITDDENAKHKFISSVEPEYTCCKCKNTFCEYCM